MLINFLDTSAILNGGLTEFDNIYVSPLSLIELENIKTSKLKDENVKYRSRNAVRHLITEMQLIDTKVNFAIYSDQQRAKILRRYKILQPISDHYIIADALLLSQEKTEVRFVTSDGAQYLFSCELPFRSSFFYEGIEKESEITGWKNCHPTDEQLASLYSDMTQNILNCRTNEFAKIYVGQDLKDVLFWNGQQYRKLNYKEFTTTLGERVKPRNLEQKMYLDLLQNNDIPVKLCVAKFGTGKSWLALSYALREVQNGRFDKIVFVKNNLEVTGAGKLGKEVAHLYSNILD